MERMDLETVLSEDTTTAFLLRAVVEGLQEAGVEPEMVWLEDDPEKMWGRPYAGDRKVCELTASDGKAYGIVYLPAEIMDAEREVLARVGKSYGGQLAYIIKRERAQTEK